MQDYPADLTGYTGAFVDELVESGIFEVVVSPGSRSTPLAMVMAAHPNLQVRIHVDERSAGFFALGIAKASRKPVALLCTSGTAAANYYPAVVEAKLARVPLVVITSDRPHELRDVGAPQAIDQIGMFGSHVKWFAETALPEASHTMLRYVRTMAARAAETASVGPAGPVHLNFPFREPLVPDVDSPTLFCGGKRPLDETRFVQMSTGQRVLPAAHLDKLAEELAGMERGLIICGPQEHRSLGKALDRLATSLCWPIVADPLSQLRRGDHNHQWVVDSYDAFLRHPLVKERAIPEVVIRFGAMPISKALMLFVRQFPNCRQLIVDPDGGWREPTLMATDMIHSDPEHFANEVAKRVEIHSPKREGTWSSTWLELDQRTREEMMAGSLQVEGLFEGRVFTELGKALPTGSLLFTGNSMPVRDMDSFFTKAGAQVRTMANRGANGIDGVTSTALGAALIEAPVVLVVGDLSFYHDLNGLVAAKLHGIDITVIVINNDGGGIFSFLPQAQQAEKTTFETLFGTPLGLDYEPVVRMYGGDFTRITNWEDFHTSLQQSVGHKGLHVMEIPTDRSTNVAAHRTLWERVQQSLHEWLDEVSF
ncbi:2-succinyl-5-enolpyruvyl-6-hydroxy-3-cyclohexene-1-carboxylic-acid synthase [Marininema halotolerans]|uniref:2-succinyl-5-enolpyruvyl-6-hydroxy-3-cyclohexene-1-carboxylate synthase n=1 Tax=Marininema halotolerans TaxID=1155944 RepID=A0A1I6PM95_9BACL|nr:2-succinyl-5-enolpyruvyl-6-hydroxy-3-cyclohexene-1-carboxylic-acid synthase [Marininema halotolerans]SFS41343.1 2-succinyl-5-enolpyruvyl-6-hydroxy-3-cyclohexene-1-carboxylate synthase [Marininema halotolerans]